MKKNRKYKDQGEMIPFIIVSLSRSLLLMIQLQISSRSKYFQVKLIKEYLKSVILSSYAIINIFFKIVSY